MFDRWLALWRRTTANLFAPRPADAFQDKAERVAESLSFALFFTLDNRKTDAVPA
jgi:hemoglobin